MMAKLSSIEKSIKDGQIALLTPESLLSKMFSAISSMQQSVTTLYFHNLFPSVPRSTPIQEMQSMTMSTQRCKDASCTICNNAQPTVSNTASTSRASDPPHQAQQQNRAAIIYQTAMLANSLGHNSLAQVLGRLAVDQQQQMTIIPNNEQ